MFYFRCFGQEQTKFLRNSKSIKIIDDLIRQENYIEPQLLIPDQLQILEENYDTVENSVSDQSSLGIVISNNSNLNKKIAIVLTIWQSFSGFSTTVATKKKLLQEKKTILKERKQEYVNSEGKIIKAKKVLPIPCKEQCQNGCNRFTENKREEIGNCRMVKSKKCF